MNRKINSLTAAAALGIFMLANAAFAQGTAFTYQGRLQNGTSLASGNYDLSFTLYTNSSSGSAIGGPVTNLAVAVSNGLFTTIVSFPGNPFTGTSNWLELAVRANGAASFSPPLSPRQLMSAVPYAVFAETANAAGLTGQLSNTNLPAGVALLNANQTFTGSNVFGSGAGITGGAAITSSAASVPPGSSVDPSTFLHLYNTATDGNLSSSDVVGIGFGNNSTRQAIVGGSYGNDYLEFYTDGILTSPKMRIDGAGNVGIGTNNPTAPLEVNGNAKVDGALTAASFSGDGSGLTNLNIAAAPNLQQIALLKWHPYLERNFPVGSSPGGICFDGSSIWVANSGANSVTKLNPSTGVAIGTYGVGPNPSGICYDGISIWVSNHGSNSVTTLDANSGATLGTFTVGTGPAGICSDGFTIWVACFTNVVRLGIATYPYPAGTFPSGICWDGTNVWTANFGLPLLVTNNTVTKLNGGVAGATIGTYTVGKGPAAVCFDGANIWVANSFDNTVTKLNAGTGATIGTFPVGSGPDGICFDGSSIWVANSSANSVTKLDTRTGATIGTYSSGPMSAPAGMCFDGANVWTANNGSTNVTKF